jgi:hypothetical protein
MSTLFDLPQDDPKPRRMVRAKSTTAVEKEQHTFAPTGTIDAPVKILGWLDHGHECVDERCRGSAHDIICEGLSDIDNNGRKKPAWLIQCCFCGTSQWVPVIKGHLEPKPAAFTFPDGRFAGLTIDEAATRPQGVDCIRLWATTGHRRPEVKTACETWLARNQSAG